MSLIIIIILFLNDIKIPLALFLSQEFFLKAMEESLFYGRESCFSTPLQSLKRLLKRFGVPSAHEKKHILFLRLSTRSEFFWLPSY